MPFPASAATPAQAETSNVQAQGENGLWSDDDERDRSSRARRELSVIEESSSLAPRDEVDDNQTGDAPAPEPAQGAEVVDAAGTQEPDAGEEADTETPRESPAKPKVNGDDPISFGGEESASPEAGVTA